MCTTIRSALACRQRLFRTQIERFRSAEQRSPTRCEIRCLWSGTGFRTI